MNGPTGLCYDGLPMLFGLLKVPEEERLEVYDAIEVMANEALKQMRD